MQDSTELSLNGVDGDSRYRTFWRRLWAAVFDAGVLINATAVIVMLCSTVYGPWSFVLSVSLSVAVKYAYSISTTYLISGTFGKRVLNLHVVHEGGLDRITLQQSFLRELPNLFVSVVDLIVIVVLLQTLGRDGFLAQLSSKKHLWEFDVRRYLSTFLIVIELATCLANRKRRAFHDIVAGTVVLKDEQVSWGYAALGLVLLIFGLLALGAASKPFLSAVLK